MAVKLKIMILTTYGDDTIKWTIRENTSEILIEDALSTNGALNGSTKTWK